jgi:hypothetical protein
MPTTVPSAMVSEKWSSATRDPKRFVASSTATSGIVSWGVVIFSS